MFHLKRTIYVIFAFIVIHLVMYMFEIDIFEFFDKRVSSRSSSNQVAVSENSNTVSNTAPSAVPSAVPIEVSSAVPIEVSNSETNIDTNIQELEKSLEELKDITKI